MPLFPPPSCTMKTKLQNIRYSALEAACATRQSQQRSLSMAVSSRMAWPWRKSEDFTRILFVLKWLPAKVFLIYTDSGRDWGSGVEWNFRFFLFELLKIIKMMRTMKFARVQRAFHSCCIARYPRLQKELSSHKTEGLSTKQVIFLISHNNNNYSLQISLLFHSY